MPLIPKFRANGPAQRQRPAMERDRAPRVDAGEAVQGLARLSGVIQQGGGETPQVDPNLGQGQAAGMEALGQGVENFGEALYDIERRVAEAKNYDDEHKAQLAMDREVLEFERWREEHQNPEEWEGEWQTRMQRFQGNYFAGKSLAPVAQTAIRQRMESFTSRRGVQVGMDAMRQTVSNASDALKADILRAKEAGDYEAVDALVSRGQQAGWLSDYEAERTRITVSDEIEAEQASEAIAYAEAFALRGMVEEAKEQLRHPAIPEAERVKQMARMETVTAVSIETKEAYDTAADTSPKAVAERLDAKDEYRNFTHYPHVKGAARQELAANLWGTHYAEKSSIAKVVNEGIDNGAFQTMEEVEEQFGEFEMSEVERRTYEDKLTGQYVKDESYVQQAVIDAANYDPATDPLGIKSGAMISEYEAVIGGDPRLEGILTVLGKRMNGEPLTMTEEMRASKLRETRETIEAEGSWKIPTENIKVHTDEKTGKKTYVDTSAEIEPGEAGFFEEGEGFFDGDHITGRVIQPSQEDRIKIESGAGKGFVEDLLLKNQELAKGEKAVSQLVQEAEAGRVQTPEEWDGTFQKLFYPEKDKAAKKQLDSALFGPQAPNFFGPSEDPIDAVKRRAASLEASATF